MKNSLDDIQRFCDEAAALVKAGLPLDGIAGTSSRVSANKLQALVEGVQKQTADGKSVAEVIDAVDSKTERLVTATVAAGLASGKLQHGLEMLGDVAADVKVIRQRLKAALVYPAIVMVIAAGLFSFFIRHFLVVTAEAMQEPYGSLSPVLQTLLAWDQQYSWWPIAIPIVIVLLVVIPIFCRPAGIINLRGTENLMKLIPGVRPVLTSLQFYHASRVLSLLIHHGVPLNEALVIAGTCSERTGLNAAFRKAAKNLEAGETLSGSTSSNAIPAGETLANETQSEKAKLGKRISGKLDAVWKPGQLPPLLAVALKESNGSEARLKLSLTGVTSHYHRRLQTGLMILRQYVPVGLTVFLAGTTVLLYSVAVFWPMVELYSSFVQEGDINNQ